MDDTVNHFTEHATSSELRQPSLKEDLQAAANASATSQIRQHTLDHSQWLSAADVPNAQSEQIEIKAEMTDNPIVTPYQYDGQGGEGSETASGLAGTITSIPCSKTVSGIKKDASHTPSPIPTGEAAGLPAMKSKSAPSKKRAAPKKGTASTIKPPTKKRKLESDSVDGTPSAKRTGTPATSRASETPVPKNRKQGSITPARSSSVINGDGDGGGDEDVSDENDIFCVCRKPDDHTLMIGCDGPCEDWFHARCVNMDAVRTKLIFKWYCKFSKSRRISLRF